MYPTSTTWNECNYFGDKIWLTKQGSWMAVMKMKVYGILKDEFWLNDFSWTCRWHWNELVALTQNKVMDGMIDQWYDNHQANNPTQIVTVMKWKCHVQERPATKSVLPLFPFSLVVADQYLFIFIKLEEDNICLLYNSTIWVNPSLCHVLTSLAKVKLSLGMMDKFVTIWCFNESNENDNSTLFMSREFEKGQKGNSTSSFS